MQSVLSCLVADDVAPSQTAKDFVSKIKKYFDAHRGAAFREYRRAVKVAMQTFEITKGDSILISPLAPALYADVCKELGIELIYIDVDPDNGVLDPTKISETLTRSKNKEDENENNKKETDKDKKEYKEPSLIVLHYTYGMIPDIDALLEFQLPVLEDVTHAMGTTFKEEICGTFGAMTILSMEANDIITAGGGTILCCRNKKLSPRFDDLIKSFSQDIFLSDLNAALGLMQFGNLSKLTENRRNIAEYFIKSLQKGGHRTLVPKNSEIPLPYTFPVILNTGKAKVIQFAKKNKIETLDGFADSIIASGFISEGTCPNAETLYLKCLLFPLYPGLDGETIKLLCRILSALP